MKTPVNALRASSYLTASLATVCVLLFSGGVFADDVETDASTSAPAEETAVVIPPGAAMPISAREQLQLFADGLEDLQARFRQIVRSSDGQLVDSGEGEVWLKTPNRLRWAYDGEFPELIVADGNTVWLYDETLEQVTVKSQPGLASGSPLMLLTDPDSLEEKFDFNELGHVDDLSFLELNANGTDVEFDRVMIGFKDGLPVTMALEDAFGMRTDIEFLDLKRNPGVDEALFEFEPPPGVDVIGELESNEDAD